MTQDLIQPETEAKQGLASELSLSNLRYPLIFKTPPIIHLEKQEIPPCCSKAAGNLRKNVLKAIADLKPIIFQAPPGSGKTFMAGFIHSQSCLKNTVFVEVDCSQLPRDEEQRPILDELLGTATTPGAIDSLQQGTLLIDNVHLLTSPDRDRLLKIIQNKISHGHQIRFILASPHPFPTPNLDVHPIKLFSLVQRREDIASFANYFLKRICQKHNRPLLSLSQVALRRLLSYDYPRHLVELEIILIRAVLMTPPTETSISEQALWSVQSKKNRFRVDLLTYVPWLRPALLSPWWPQAFWGLHMALFIPVILLGFWGSPLRGQSLTLNVFWAWWWPLYLLLFPFVGRLWCAVCPFMITGEWLRKLSLMIYPRSLRPWPHQWLNRWGAWCVFGGFLVIYLWEKLWDLPHSAVLSTWLLLIITAGAVLFSLIYERRLWCRYLCPIGGMNGMFAKLSMVELRATEQFCGTLCDVKACQKGSCGSPALFDDVLPQEGQAGEGCPLYSPPAQLTDNRNCVLCMGCLKSCPNRSVQLNLRFPAADLLENHHGSMAEVYLLALLLGGILLHNSQRFLSWFGLGNFPLDAQHLGMATPLAIALLSLPGLGIYLTHRFSRWLDPQLPDFVTMAYVYLPMTLAANFAYYVPSLITESGQIFPLLAHHLGLSSLTIPHLTWSMEVATFLQGSTLLSIVPLSIFVLMKVSQRSLWRNLPHLSFMISLTGLFLALMVW